MTACLLGCAPTIASEVSAADVPWITNGGGAYHVGANWFGGAAPTTADRAVFSLPITKTVWLTGPAMSGALLAESGDVTLNLNGATLAFTNPTSAAIIGLSSVTHPTLRLREGSLTASTTDVGLNDNSTGHLVLGPGAVWQNALDTRIAYGKFSSASAHVHSGAALNVQRDLFIAVLQNANGAAVVENPGSRIQVTRELNVGMDATGLLHVRDGGRVTAKDIYLARSSRAHADFIVEGPESSAAFVFKLSAGSGFRADGRVRIDNGADVYSFFGVLGEIQESKGHARIANGAHWEIENAFYVGFRALGTLEIESGATLNSKFTNLGFYNNSAGHAHVRGSGTRWQNLQYINVGVAANTTGSLTVESGGVVASETIVVGPSGALRGDGVIEAHVTNNGIVEPGMPGEEPGAPSGVGALTIRGGYTQTPNAGGALRMQIGGFSPGVTHDTLVVEGAATLGGALHVEFIDGFNPQMGVVFPLLSATSITGAFNTIALPTFPDGRFCILFSNGSTLYMTVLQGLIPPPPGPPIPPMHVDFSHSDGSQTDTDPPAALPPTPLRLTPNALRTLIHAVLESHSHR